MKLRCIYADKIQREKVALCLSTYLQMGGWVLPFVSRVLRICRLFYCKTFETKAKRHVTNENLSLCKYRLKIFFFFNIVRRYEDTVTTWETLFTVVISETAGVP